MGLGQVVLRKDKRALLAKIKCLKQSRYAVVFLCPNDIFNEKILNLEGFLWQSDSPFVNDWKRSIRLGFLSGLDLCDR